MTRVPGDERARRAPASDSAAVCDGASGDGLDRRPRGGARAVTEGTSRNGSARLAPGAEARPVSAPAAPSAESAAERACIEALGRIAELHAELAAATRTLAENLKRELALRAEPSLMVNDVKSPVTEPAMPELLTARQLAAILQIDPRTLRTRVRRGEVPEPIKIGGSIRWRRKTIENYIAEAEEQTR